MFMKIFLTLILTVFIVTVYGQVPFTQGNVVVFRVGKIFININYFKDLQRNRIVFINVLLNR